jgi:hypothetical protein
VVPRRVLSRPAYLAGRSRAERRTEVSAWDLQDLYIAEYGSPVDLEHMGALADGNPGRTTSVSPPALRDGSAPPAGTLFWGRQMGTGPCLRRVRRGPFLDGPEAGGVRPHHRLVEACSVS